MDVVHHSAVLIASYHMIDAMGHFHSVGHTLWTWLVNTVLLFVDTVSFNTIRPKHKLTPVIMKQKKQIGNHIFTRPLMDSGRVVSDVFAQTQYFNLH